MGKRIHKQDLTRIKKILVGILATLIILHYLIPSAFAKSDNVLAVDGELDLTDIDWEKAESVALDGQWEFYWNELLDPGSFEYISLLPDKEIIEIPRSWNKYKLGSDVLSGDGYATFRLNIFFPDNRILGIKVPRIFTAYNMWVNGELIASAGKVSANETEMVPQYLPQVRFFTPESQQAEIVIQISNFKHRSGGILESIRLGTADNIHNMRVRNLALELFMFGGIFIIGCYHIFLFLFRTKERSVLYFGAYCLFISARTLLVGEIYLVHLFPRFNWEIAHKIQTLAYYVGVFLVVSFIKTMFPKDFSALVGKVVRVVTIVFALLVLLTPAKIFTLFNPAFQLYSIAVIIYLVALIAVACFRKREGAYLIGIGMIIMIVFALNDIVFLSIFFADADSGSNFLRSIITKGNLSSIGLLILIFTQSLVLAKKFSSSFYQVENLTEDLQLVNDSLEQKVMERTRELENSKDELNKAYIAVSRTEKSLEDLIQNISHDLRTPLSSIKGYVNVILDGIVKDTDKQKKYLIRVKEKADHLNTMVQELLDLSRLQSRQQKFDFNSVSVSSYVKSCSEKYGLDTRGKNCNFHIVDLTGLVDCNPYLMVDSEKMERVFSNLFSNAIKYSSGKVNIELRFDIDTELHELVISVTDNGIGISPENLPRIFDRFYMSSKARSSDTNFGLGLAIVKEIIESHNGRVWVKSELGKGSSFIFTLPVRYN